MVRFPPTPGGNDRRLHAHIMREAGAPLGPVTVRPGEGSISFYSVTGSRMFSASPDSVLLYAHGQERELGPLVESKASITYVDGNVRTLTDVNTAQNTRMDTMQVDINTRATRTYVDGNITTLVSRANGADSRLDGAESRLDGLDTLVASKASRTYVDGNVTTLSGRITTAQSRADSAYSLAASKASSSDVSNAVATAKQYTDSRINALVTALRDQGVPVVV